MHQKQPIYLLVGCPGSGKTWVVNQVKEKFKCVLNDDYIGKPYVTHILKESVGATKPLLIEAPFSISQVKDPLEQSGLKVVPLVILEKNSVVADRYLKREAKHIPVGHLTRMATYEKRAKENKWFSGTSAEVLEHLKGI